MNTLRQACAVAILTVILAVSAPANSGQIQCPAATAAPPQPSETTSELTSITDVTTSIILTLIELIN